MSAPALPEAFGNYALGDFVEVVAPPSISWLPQTDGWWWLGAALLALGLHRGWKRLRHWYRNRYRREASARLRRLVDSGEAPGLVAEANKLLKLAAMVAYSREAVAKLSGAEWVDFLNRQCPQPVFTSEQGDLLAVGAYRCQVLDVDAREGLLRACLSWMQEHRGGQDD